MSVSAQKAFENAGENVEPADTTAKSNRPVRSSVEALISLNWRTYSPVPVGVKTK